MKRFKLGSIINFQTFERRDSGAILIDNSGSLETLKKSLDQALAKCI